MECPGPHEEVYDIDYDDCTTDPEELRKGMDAFLILVGVMTEDEYVTNLHMDVWWNGVYMRREDHKMNDEIEEQEAYFIKMLWNIPAFSPSGLYEINLIPQAGGVELGCARAVV